MLPLSFADTIFLYSTLAISFKLFLSTSYFAVTASSTPFSGLRTHPRYKNYATILITLPFIATSLSTFITSRKTRTFLAHKTYFLVFPDSKASFVHSTVTFNV